MESWRRDSLSWLDVQPLGTCKPSTGTLSPGAGLVWLLSSHRGLQVGLPPYELVSAGHVGGPKARHASCGPGGSCISSLFMLSILFQFCFHKGRAG
jgi:hypothetical protein